MLLIISVSEGIYGCEPYVQAVQTVCAFPIREESIVDMKHRMRKWISVEPISSGDPNVHDNKLAMYHSSTPFSKNERSGIECRR